MNEQTYRELLTLAAKAVKIEGDYEPKYFHGAGPNNHGIYVKDTGWVWNPLDDDGDALRLAVKLDIEVFQGQEENGPSACAGYWGKPWRRDVSRLFIVEPYTNPANDNSPYAATRLAIVRAAAEIALAQAAGNL